MQQRYAGNMEGGVPLWIQIEDIQIIQSTNPGRESITVTVTAQSKNLQYADKLMKEIRKTEYFAKAEIHGPVTPTENGVKFTIKSIFPEP